MNEEPNEMSETVSVLPDVADMKLDLTKDEKLRSAALMLAIRYHVDTIIKDAAYLQLMMQREKELQFSNDPDKAMWHLSPTTVNSVVHIAQEFEQFLLGNRSAVAQITVDGKSIGHDGDRAQGSLKSQE